MFSRGTKGLQSKYHRPSPYSRFSTNTMKSEVQKVQPLVFGTSLFMSNKGLTSFSQLSFNHELKEINLSNNEFIDFYGFPTLPNLTLLDLSKNPIASLKGFPSFPKLDAIVLKGTPVSRNEYYRIGLILLCPSIKIIDGTFVTLNERQLAKKYPSECRNLIRVGWNPKYPPPNPSEFVKIRASLSSNQQKAFQMSASKRSQPQPLRKIQKQSEIFKQNIEKQQLAIDKLNKEIKKIENRLKEQQKYLNNEDFPEEELY